MLPGKDHSWAGVDRQSQSVIEIHVIQPVLRHLPGRVGKGAITRNGHTHLACGAHQSHPGSPKGKWGPFTRSCTFFIHSFIPQTYAEPRLWARACVLPVYHACPSALSHSISFLPSQCSSWLFTASSMSPAHSYECLIPAFHLSLLP